MDIENLRYFIVLCEKKKFTEAAFECDLSQSALSKHIKKLENELDVELFKRTTHATELTKAGEKFLFHAKKLVASYEDCMFDMQEEIENKLINLGCMTVLSPYHIPRMLNDYAQKHPDQKLSVKESKAKIIIDRIDDYDLIIIRPYLLENQDKYNIYQLYDDELCVVVSKEHALAKEDKIDMKDLKNENFIFPEKGSGGYEVYEHVCKEAGYNPNIIYELPQTNTMFSFVEENIGVALSFKKVYREYENEKIKMISLAHQEHYPIALVHKKNKKIKPYQKSFIKHCQNYCENNS